jgi:phosphoribosylanthranilate isomerase
MTWVKICGMTNLDDALVAVDAGADAVGFVFYEKSPRCVSVETAREIVKGLPGQLDKIGVFVNESPERVSTIADEAGLTAVQFHGDEYRNPGQCSVGGKIFVCLPVVDLLAEWKEFERVESGFYGIPQLPRGAAIVLDSGNQRNRGGTGRRFDWTKAHSFAEMLRTWYPVVVAGGLTPENVSDAMRLMKPWGVDVASGVEARPGKKDPEKVWAFVRAVREMDQTIY